MAKRIYDESKIKTLSSLEHIRPNSGEGIDSLGARTESTGIRGRPMMRRLLDEIAAAASVKGDTTNAGRLLGAGQTACG